jgi:hypothetical protein
MSSSSSLPESGPTPLPIAMNLDIPSPCPAQDSVHVAAKAQCFVNLCNTLERLSWDPSDGS